MFANILFPLDGSALASAALPLAAVAMATHGRTGVVRALFGSAAGAVMYHSAVPLVLVRPRPSSHAG